MSVSDITIRNYQTNISSKSGTTPEVHTHILNEENYREIELRWYLDYVWCALRCLQSINTAIELVTKSHNSVTQPTSHMHLNLLTAIICNYTKLSVSKTISPDSVRHLLKVRISKCLEQKLPATNSKYVFLQKRISWTLGYAPNNLKCQNVYRKLKFKHHLINLGWILGRIIFFSSSIKGKYKGK